MNLEVVYAFSAGFACGIAMTLIARGIALITATLRRSDEDWRVGRRDW